jgi:hypothetical protein
MWDSSDIFVGGTTDKTRQVFTYVNTNTARQDSLFIPNLQLSVTGEARINPLKTKHICFI